MDSELLFVFDVFVSCAGWVIAVLVVVVARTPPRPPAGPKTLDLGPEPRLEQGDLITARLSRNLSCVRWIISAEGAGAAG